MPRFLLRLVPRIVCIWYVRMLISLLYFCIRFVSVIACITSRLYFSFWRNLILHSRDIGSCPVTTDCIVAMYNVRTTVSKISATLRRLRHPIFQFCVCVWFFKLLFGLLLCYILLYMSYYYFLALRLCPHFGLLCRLWPTTHQLNMVLMVLVLALSICSLFVLPSAWSFRTVLLLIHSNKWT